MKLLDQVIEILENLNIYGIISLWWFVIVISIEISLLLIWKHNYILNFIGIGVLWFTMIFLFVHISENTMENKFEERIEESDEYLEDD